VRRNLDLVKLPVLLLLDYPCKHSKGLGDLEEVSARAGRFHYFCS
jgi:hypothetical protein